MKAFLLVVGLVLAAQSASAAPPPRGSCYRKLLKERDCHGGADPRMRVRPIASLHNHFWEGEACDVVCYCNFRELLCCPRDVFFGPKISFVIPCRTT